MRVLVTWGSKRGGTEGIGQQIAHALEANGHAVTALPAAKVPRHQTFDAAIIGGALYANRWHRSARIFVDRHERRLREVPVWFFSSGPLDVSAEQGQILPTRQVRELMERVGAQGHMTFGGRLQPSARGFPASAMAKKNSGDWRSPAQIQAWSMQIAAALPAARPLPAASVVGHSLSRLALHAVVAWGFCAVTLGLLTQVASMKLALTLHAMAAPVWFWAVAHHYFARSGARDPRSTAVVFTATAMLLDIGLVGGLIEHSWVMLSSLSGFWLPLALGFAATWATGEVMSMLPFPKPPQAHPSP